MDFIEGLLKDTPVIHSYSQVKPLGGHNSGGGGLKQGSVSGGLKGPKVEEVYADETSIMNQSAKKSGPEGAYRNYNG